MTVERHRPKTVFRRMERWAVGLVMAVVAFVLEKVVMRSVRRKGMPETAPPPSTLTSKGGRVDLDESLSGSG